MTAENRAGDRPAAALLARFNEAAADDRGKPEARRQERWRHEVLQ